MANRNVVGIFAVDPGVTTGVARGLFDLRQPTVAACMRRARSKRLLESCEVKGHYVRQAWQISKAFADWVFNIHVERHLVEFGKIYFVIEDFQPQQLNFDITPIELIGGIETLLLPQAHVQGYEGERAQPNQKWANDAWLREHRLWVSSDHERDARRHVAGKLDRLL